MRRYRVSRTARRDLSDIYRYVAERNLAAAERIHDLFFARFRLLAQHPLLGQARDDLAENLRILSVGNYLIAYQPTKRGIDVLRVLHSARDIDTILRRRPS